MAGGKQFGETTVYSRNVGYDIRQNYVASGDGAGQLQFVGLSAPNNSASDATWNIRKFFYDSSNRLIIIIHADGDDAFDNVYSDRESLNYPNAP